MNEQGFVGVAYAPVVVFFATGVVWIWFIPSRGLLCAIVGIFNLSAKVVSIKKSRSKNMLRDLCGIWTYVSRCAYLFWLFR